MPVVISGTNGVSGVDGTASNPSYEGTDSNTGIFFPAADTIAFAEGGTEVGRFDSSGNFGIGTSSPDEKLTVTSTNPTGGLIASLRNNGTSSLTGSKLWFNQNTVDNWNIGQPAGVNAFVFCNSTGSTNERMRIDSSGNVGIGTSSPLATAMLEVSRSTTVIPTATVTADAQVVGWRSRRTGGSFPREYYIGIRENSTALDFYDNTANALRASIDSSGRLLVGLTSTRSNGGAIQAAAIGQSGLVTYTNTTSTNSAAYFENPNGVIGSIQTTNSSTSYNTSSDYRLKNTIAPMTGALEKVALLKPCTYKWNADGSDGQGFIAHELAEVVPQCVTGEKDAVDSEGKPVYQGIDTSFLVATLTAAIKEQQQMIETLQAKVTALEAK